MLILGDTQLISKYNQDIPVLLSAIYVYSRYAWVAPQKNKKDIEITNAFQKFLVESNRKPNKIWLDKFNEIYNRSMKTCLQDNDIEVYLAHNEGKSVIA